MTYAGHPLYTYVGDTKAGMTTGEGLTDFGWTSGCRCGEWPQCRVALVDSNGSDGGYGGYGSGR